MKALWLENRKLTFRQDVPKPVPASEEALVRVRLAGICATDLEMVRGYYPFTGIPGHEFVGEVVAAPDEESWLDKRVVGEINLTCGVCWACRNGRRSHCENRTTLGIHDRDGAFAEYLTLPLENLHPVPETVPDEAAVFTEPLAAALQVQEQVHIHPNDRVLVIGAGRLGQLIAQTLALTAGHLRVVARHPQQRKLLTQRGIQTLNDGEVGERAWDLVIEATGSAGGFELARAAVRPRGLIVLKSTYAGSIQADFSTLVVNEITLIGSRCGPFAPALRLLESELVEPRPLIAERHPLADGVLAFEHAAQSGVMKVLLSL